MGPGSLTLYVTLLLPTTLLLALATAQQCTKTGVARFTRNQALSFPGHELENHVIKEFSTKYQATQCAMECFLEKRCKSFNFDSSVRKCQLSDATHKDFPADLQKTNATAEYHLRGAFSLDQKAIGPCGSNPCQNEGRCLDTKSASGDRMYICLCKKGWSGRNCDMEENHLEWGEWGDWGTCSVSCGHGYQSRTRKCEDTVTGKDLPSTKCYGRDIEFQACPYKDCPRWEEWGAWGPCSTFTTCGRGFMIRNRNCSNGGKAGVDRYCKGSETETTVCEGITCNSMVRLQHDPKFKYGEGRVEIYNDQSNAWMPLCADNWNMTGAEIACKQTGFMGANEVVTDGTYDTEKNDNNKQQYIRTHCNGTEHFLQECQREGASTCSKTAGVKCRVKGVWNLWTPWSVCSVTCENGTQVRTRLCNHPPPNHGGLMCPGNNTEYKACSLPMCPIDGYWLPWSQWSECSVTCANGTQNRSRECNMPKYGGSMCDGPYDEVRNCYPRECPVDGNWEPWTSWTTCTSTCGYGSQTRNRTCIEPLHGGALCPGASDEVQVCNAFSCPIDGSWKPWSQWSDCTVSCGGGKEHRTRECVDPQHGGKICPGPADEEQTCNEHECPVDGVFTTWSLWTVCSVTCANGTRERNRTCTGPFYGGQNCTGDYGQQEVCVTASCPVDGVWKPWSQWDACNVTCGGGGQKRYRECEGPFFGGSPCNGSTVDWKECNMHHCPIDGVWTDWANWTECSVTCGGGSQNRNRTCIGPFYGGANCTGNDTETQGCNPHPCPVDGYWASWANWTSCNVSCGGGMRWRTRECVLPLYGGATCHGTDLESKTCNEHNCPVDGIWEMWSDWESCSLTCGNGTQTRNRTCMGPFFGGQECPGPADELRSCNTFECPVDGVWEMWSNWSACSHSCGRGSQMRNRTCIGPFFGGAACSGAELENRYCNPSNCPVDGIFLDWGTWSDCSHSCGTGQRTRNRTCDGPYFGGRNCVGNWSETEDCNTHYCPVDGIFDDWSEWSNCTLPCGSGNRTRERDCIGPYFGGKMCQGNFSDTEPCNTHPCPVDGVWDSWASWGACNVSCGGGTKLRDRNCTGPFFGGAPCNGSYWDSVDCNTHPCPVDGIWDDWSEWGMCNVSCGTGEQIRTRNCSGPFFGGAKCQGPYNDFRICNDFECPIDGVWATWSKWDICSVTCGGGNQSRYRECDGPFFGGMNCSGPSIHTRDCNTHECPIDGVFDDWSDWYSCNVTCGGGIQWRNRTCIGPFYGGAPCNGSYDNSRDCNMHECPVDGVFDEWSDWYSCNVTCGGGIQWRNRTCNGPFFGGAPCEGEYEDSRTCNEHECPIDGVWDSWSDWDACNVTCAGGLQQRRRTCIGPFFGGAQCDGPAKEDQDCNTHNCPVDGVFATWSTWSSCNVTCGGGFQWRNRTCIGPFYGGQNCSGEYEDFKDCNMHNCPIDGFWKDWTDWGECTVTCGGGLRYRYRYCEGPFYGGANCTGHDVENLICGTNECPIPGEWLEWSSWTACSVTCGGGTRERNRICNETSYGNLTDPCLGPSNETQSCHKFSCLPFARHCTELVDWGLIDSTYVEVKITNRDKEPGYKVFCDVEAENGIGVSVVYHDKMEKELVTGYEGAGSYKIKPNYVMPYNELVKLVDNSAVCSQFVEWECKGASIHNPHYNDQWITYWVNRTNDHDFENSGAATYFPGGEPGSGKCACGMTNSCDNATLPCNCDMNDFEDRVDSGFITNKAELPLRAFCVGDTGGFSEIGNATVGSVNCWGYLN